MSVNAIPVARLKLGKIVSTPIALARLSLEDILRGLQRHQAGDWGEVDESARQANDCALSKGRRLRSVYHSATGTEFWMVTEGDRSATTVLLPEEY